ncbi:MAG: GNAT family N-acetyltransferase [Candidatus Omnitrophota bacterium]|jgi:GNAT superfamily N-acetyltransferase
MIEFVPAVDASAVCRIEKLAWEIWREHYSPIIGPAQVDYMLRRFQSVSALNAQMRSGYQYYLLRLEGKVSGYLGMLPERHNERLFLSKIYIRAACRGKGYGRKSLEFTEALAGGMGLKKVSLTVNKGNSGAIKAYINCGFNISGPVVTDIGNGFIMDDYLMEKSLCPSI